MTVIYHSPIVTNITVDTFYFLIPGFFEQLRSKLKMPRKKICFKCVRDDLGHTFFFMDRGTVCYPNLDITDMWQKKIT